MKRGNSIKLDQPTPLVRTSSNDNYYGRKEISQLIERTVFKLFPKHRDTDSASPFRQLDPNAIPSSSSKGGESDDFAWSSKCNESVSHWLAWVLYRAKLPEFIIHHSLYLLHRLSSTYSFTMSTTDDLLHRRLIFTSLILATKYSLDNSYTNASWSEASKYLFSVREISQMELEVLSWLGWRLGEPDLEAKVGQWIESCKKEAAEEPESPVEKAITNTTSLLRAVQSEYRHRTTRTVAPSLLRRHTSKRERLRNRIRHSLSISHVDSPILDVSSSSSENSSSGEETSSSDEYTSRQMDCFPSPSPSPRKNSKEVMEEKRTSLTLSQSAMIPPLLAHLSTQIILSTSGYGTAHGHVPGFNLLVDRVPC
ncbi:hypothetical protein BT69DRAFT_1289851 [Atractiella rhizophila]|nr:hypothetical protein BT69DRAFT_1289851 [Atractiella rhizophila]